MLHSSDPNHAGNRAPRGASRLPVVAVAAAATLLAACSSIDDTRLDREPANEGPTEVVAVSEVDWQQLNPARGDQSPRAGTLWGDRGGTQATGFLLAPVDGFRSPPHIHNVTYRGVVIRGLIHNDDPDAEEMWMPSGSFWTQPKGEVHITAAKGSDTLAYIEIDAGPYLVRPVDKAFESGERPINVDASNIVWVRAPGTVTGNGPKVAYLWGDPEGDEPHGTMLELPADFRGMLRSRGSAMRVVVIQGRPSLRLPGQAEVTSLEPGSFFRSTGTAMHHLAAGGDAGCVLYVRMAGSFDVVPARATK